MQILWMINLSASLIFIIQTILTFTGMDTYSGLDVPDGGFDSSRDVISLPF